MAMTQDQLTAAQTQAATSKQAWQTAEAALQTVLNNPDTPKTSPEGQAAYNKAIAAKNAYKDDQTRADKAQTQFTKENPPTKTSTPQGPDAAEATRQKQRNAADPNDGRYETDVDREKREKGPQQKPARIDSPAQTETAQTGAANSAETARNNQMQAAQKQAELQVAAQKEAIDASNNRFNQISTNAAQAQDAGYKNIEQVRSAATTVVNQQQTERQQEIDLQKSRQTFFNDVTNGLFSGIVQMIKMGSNGSKAAQAFAASYLAMANSNYVKGGYDKEPDKIDQNSPAMAALRKISGYTLPDQQPTMPSTDQLDWATMVSMARAGNPPPGWHGPIGAAAMQIPATPENIAKYTGVSPQTAQQKADQETQRQLQEAQKSPEGQQILDAMPANIKAIAQKKKDGQVLTSDEAAQLAQYQGQMKQQLQDVYNKKHGLPTSAASSEVAKPGDPGYGAPVAPTPPAGTSTDPITGMPMTPDQAQKANTVRTDTNLGDNQPNFTRPDGSFGMPGSDSNQFYPTVGAPNRGYEQPQSDSLMTTPQQQAQAQNTSPLAPDQVAQAQNRGNQYTQNQDVPDFTTDNFSQFQDKPDQTQDIPDYSTLFKPYNSPQDTDQYPYNFNV